MKLKLDTKTILFIVSGLSFVPMHVLSDTITFNDGIVIGNIVKMSATNLEVLVGCDSNDSRLYEWHEINSIDIDEKKCTNNSKALFGRGWGSGLAQKCISNIEIEYFFNVTFRGKSKTLSAIAEKITLLDKEAIIKLLSKQKNIFGPKKDILSIQKMAVCLGETSIPKAKWPVSYVYKD
jgi:hypothetical protein